MWKRQNAWSRLTHVCRKWRAIVFASSSRLDLGITIGPHHPSHIKTILSSSLPIFIKYGRIYSGVSIGSARWRMLAALKHHDRVRKISFEEMSVEFEKFFDKTQCAFPVLESLSLCFKHIHEAKLPNTFLKGPDPSSLNNLRHLKLGPTTLASISDFLLSATALTHLSLQIDAACSPSAEASLLACLQGMPCLCSLDLSLTHKSPSQPPTPKDIVRLSKLTFFHFVGSSVDLDALVAGLSAPSLLDVDFKFHDEIWPPIVHLPRFNDEIENHYRVIFMPFQENNLCLSFYTHSDCNGDEPMFKFGPVWRHHPESIIRMSDAFATMLSAVEELDVSLFGMYVKSWEDCMPWRRFLQWLASVKVLRIEDGASYFGRTLSEKPDSDLGFLPALTEIELSEDGSDERAAVLAYFQPFVIARQQAGCPVKVFFDS